MSSGRVALKAIALVMSGLVGVLVVAGAFGAPSMSSRRDRTLGVESAGVAGAIADVAMPTESPTPVPGAPAGTARVAVAAQGAPDRAMALENLQIMMSASWEAMQASDLDLGAYMYHWRTVTKVTAAGAKIASGDYEYVSQEELGKYRETEDVTILAVSDGRKFLVFRYKRESDAFVFKVIDECAVHQQDEWSRAVTAFNLLPEAERKRLSELDRTARGQIRSIMLKGQGGSGVDPARVSELRASMLPSFMVVNPRDNVAWARKSIGR